MSTNLIISIIIAVVILISGFVIVTIMANKSDSQVNKSDSQVNKSDSQVNKSDSQVNKSDLQVNKSDIPVQATPIYSQPSEPTPMDQYLLPEQDLTSDQDFDLLPPPSPEYVMLPQDLTSQEVTSQQVTSQEVTSQQVTSQQVTSQQVTSQDNNSIPQESGITQESDITQVNQAQDPMLPLLPTLDFDLTPSEPVFEPEPTFVPVSVLEPIPEPVVEPTQNTAYYYTFGLIATPKTAISGQNTFCFLNCSSPGILAKAKEYYENESVWAGKYSITPMVGASSATNQCDIKYNHAPINGYPGYYGVDMRRFTFQRVDDGNACEWKAIDVGAALSGANVM